MMSVDAATSRPHDQADVNVDPVPQRWSHIDELESEAIHIFRETAAEFTRPVLLFSGGKDSAVLLHLAEKAFRPGRLPFPLLHIDTGHNFPEVLAFRDRIAEGLDEQLIVRQVQDSIDSGRVEPHDPKQSRNAAQAVTLLDSIAEFQFNACIGGARREEEKARAKERFFSVRNEFGQWDPRNQRPELWHLFNTHLQPGQNMRVFPLSNWTEADIWSYVARERIELPSLYYAHERQIIRRNGSLLPESHLIDEHVGDQPECLVVRFRTVGDMSCTMPVESAASTPEAVLQEVLETRISERGATRLDDRSDEASMEKRKRAGYF